LLSLYHYQEDDMKKMMIFGLVIMAVGNIVFADQSIPTTTIRGMVELNNGMISVVSGNTTYIIRGLERYIGIIEGFRAGVQVSLEGHAINRTGDSQNVILFNPLVLTLNGQNYEIASSTPSNLPTDRAGSGIFNRDSSPGTRR